MKLALNKIIAPILLLCCLAQMPRLFAQDEIDTKTPMLVLLTNI